MIVETFQVGTLACNCTVIGDASSGRAIVIDGGDGIEDVMDRLERHALHADLLIHTHAHIDHIGDVGRLRELTGARALLHVADLPLYRTLELQARWIGSLEPPKIVELDGELSDCQQFLLGEARIRVLHTPGHTPGSVSFALRGGESERLFTGDTLFAGSIGRWDLGGTSMADIVQSIRTKLLPFADETPVIPGHGGPTTIGVERRTNPYLQ
jgi:hydroxyacylglutathione hydrolase